MMFNLNHSMAVSYQFPIQKRTNFVCGKSVKNKTENIDNTSGNGKTLKKKL